MSYAEDIQQPAYNTKYSKTLIVYLTLIGCYSINIFCFISEQIGYRCKADVASYVKLKRQQVQHRTAIPSVGLA